MAARSPHSCSTSPCPFARWRSSARAIRNLSSFALSECIRMDRYPGVELFAAVSLSLALPLPLAAQGGWHAWDLYLRDGSRIEANPLGAPDDTRLAFSVGGMEERGHDRTIARHRVALIAAQTTVGSRRDPIP